MCEVYGYTRQGYRKHAKVLQRDYARDVEIVRLTKEFRKRQPKAGYRMIMAMLRNTNNPMLRISKDKLIELLRWNGLLLKAPRRFVATTNWKHKLKIYPNLLPETEITAKDQVWVTDITYISVMCGFVYLFLVTDYYSRKIVGYYLSDNLTADGAVRAFNMAKRNTKLPKGIILHSDHGVQYCSKRYIKLLKMNKAKVSMTGPNHCYDNAVAERVNRTLKHDLGLIMKFPTKAIAMEATKDATSIYNQERYHSALDYKTPEDVYVA